jgi:DNA polymerase III subunit beta
MILIKAQRDALVRPLQTVSGIVERRHTLPILSNVLIRKVGSVVSFVSTDIEIQITSHSEIGQAGENASITVSARKLLDILRALPNDSEVTVALASRKLTITQNKVRFNLQTLSADEFPTVKQPEQINARITMTQRSLRGLMHAVHFAMAQQDIRYYLNGLLLVVDQNHLRAVATDGHRLAFNSISEISVTEKTTEDKIELIVPRKAIIELQKLLQDNDDPVHVEFSSNQVKFHLGTIEILSKLIEGKFPDYQRVIPKNHTKHIQIAREIFHGALSRAAILTSEKFKGVRLTLAEHALKISSTNAEQEEAIEELEVAYEHEPLDIGFNVQYLIDVLSNQKSQYILLSLQDTNSSALISTPEDSEFKYVVMPMRI